MIFVTVGTQLSFDRMVDVMNHWASTNEEEVIAQVGSTDRLFSFINQHKFLDPNQFDRYFSEARLIVAHAGMGSIISALSNGKLIIIVPRKVELGEHRNNHQVATARKFERFSGVKVAWDEEEIPSLIASHTHGENFVQLNELSRYAPKEFIRSLSLLIG